MKECSVRRVVKIAFVLAFFQAMFTLVGYLLGFSFLKLIETIDHWIAFGLLLYLGGRMIWESCQEKEEDKKMNPLCLKTLCGLGIATSIDALAVGVSFACLKVEIVKSVLVIGLMTAAFSAFGVQLGHVFGCRFKSKAEFAGGLILVVIGVKILLEHLL